MRSRRIPLHRNHRYACVFGLAELVNTFESIGDVTRCSHVAEDHEPSLGAIGVYYHLDSIQEGVTRMRVRE